MVGIVGTIRGSEMTILRAPRGKRQYGTVAATSAWFLGPIGGRCRLDNRDPFTPESAHLQCNRRCPLCANSGQKLRLRRGFGGRWFLAKPHR
jgi:hypothetical protein